MIKLAGLDYLWFGIAIGAVAALSILLFILWLDDRRY